jgi:hypothetical protein
MEDVRIGRQAVGNQSTVNVQTTVTPLVPQVEDRVALIISAPQTNRITLTFDPVGTLDNGITLYPTQPPLYLTVDRFGRLVQGPIFCVSATGAQNISYWESILNKT